MAGFFENGDGGEFTTTAKLEADRAKLEADRAKTEADNSAASASNASTSEANAATSESTATAAANSASSSATAAEIARDAAIVARDSALDSANNAATSETNTVAAKEEFFGTYYGSFATDPVLDPNGDPIDDGDLYYNTTDDEIKIYSGGSWSTYIGNVDDVLFTNYAERQVVNGDTDFDWSEANTQNYILTSGQTFTFSNIRSDGASKLELFITGGDVHAVTWPVNVVWVGGAAPTLTAKDLIVFNKFTNDSNIFGLYVGSLV